MTGEVQPVCGRCGHTPLEHSAGPCHQRSASGVGCDCGGWAEIVTGGDGNGHSAPSGDPPDTDEMVAEARRQAALGAIMPELPGDRLVADLADRLIDEVDRLRAEVDALAAALADIAGMRPVIVAGREMWYSDAECSDLRGVPCHALEPDQPENWCPVCVAEICWCAWRMGVLA